MELANDWLDVPASVVLTDDSSFDVPRCTEETEETEEIEEIEDTEEAEETDVVGEEVWKEITSAIEASTLTSLRSSNGPLFTLARRVRGVERRHNLRFSPILLLEFFESWKARNEIFLRPAHDYFTEFLVKLQAVKQPWGESLLSALEVAYSSPPTSRVLVIDDPDAHALASLCRELQRRAGAEPFYLIGRACAALLSRPHSTVAGWLRAFQPLGIVGLVEQGRRRRGSRYRYIAED